MQQVIVPYQLLHHPRKSSSGHYIDKQQRFLKIMDSLKFGVSNWIEEWGLITKCHSLFVGTLRHEIENGNLVDAVSLDLSKAFDSLSHEILLKNWKH